MKPSQTDAAAQSVVMARLARDAASEQAAPPHKAAEAYGAPQAEAPDASAVTDEQPMAEAPQPDTPTGWSFERRRQNIPRTTVIQDAEIL